MRWSTALVVEAREGVTYEAKVADLSGALAALRERMDAGASHQ